MTMDQEIWKTLPWVANGRLGETERAGLHREIERNEPLRRGLAWEQLLRETVRAESEAVMAPPWVLAQLLSRIAGEAPPNRTAKRSESVSWFTQLFSAWQWSPQLALACGLVVLQFGVIGHLWTARSEADTYSETRATEVAATLPTLFLRVNFDAEITEGGMRELLFGVGAEIVAGPYQLGDYYLYVNQEEIDRVAQALQADQRIAHVEKVDGLPTRP